MADENETSWAAEEFADVNLGDKRLDARLIMLCNRFSDAPESPINQACADWAETKAAYRFFQNDNVEVGEMLLAHRCKTAQRVKGHKTVLALQDTSYFVYTNHPKTKGLGKMSLKKGKNVKKIYSNGLMVHTCLAVTTAGLPLGLLDQKIFLRKLRKKNTGKAKPHDHLPIEEKESYRWLEALENTKVVTSDTEIVTVCDREADLYDFFKRSVQIGAPVLVRANADRTINRSSRYAEKNVEKLWEHMRQQPDTGSFMINIPKRSKTKHCKEREARTATVSVSFGSFALNPPRNNVKHGTEQLPDIEMYAVYVLELDPPDGEESVEWMLLTNLPVMSYEDAYEKVLWYCLRWRIGASSQGRIIQSVKVRPRLIDSMPRSLEGAVARKQDGEALRQHSLKGGCATHQVVTYSERRRSLVTRTPVAETVDNARRQQEITGGSHIRYFSPAGYQRRHGVKDHAETGEALDARRRNLDEEFRPITLNGKWQEWRQGDGSGCITVDPRAAKRAGREGPGPVDIPFGKVRQG